ncbi:MAG: DUF1778 domain-containing protein [Pseudorhizobium sp.]
MPSVKKDEIVNLRMDSGTRDIIARAAAVSGKSITSFMTEAAVSSAQKELLDQRFVGLDASVFDAVEDLLAQPAQVNDRLVALFKSNPEWID